VLSQWVEEGIQPNIIPIKQNSSSDVMAKEGTLKPYPQLAIYN
jgi:hypothetical protein